VFASRADFQEATQKVKNKKKHSDKSRIQPHCPACLDDKSGRGSSCDRTFPVSLIYALIVSPAPAVTSTLCRFPLVVLQQTSQSCSTPHCSFVPSCIQPRRKQDPVVFALVIALPLAM
jgi:hypothetical protein